MRDDFLIPMYIYLWTRLMNELNGLDEIISFSNIYVYKMRPSPRRSFIERIF